MDFRFREDRVREEIIRQLTEALFNDEAVNRFKETAIQLTVEWLSKGEGD